MFKRPSFIIVLIIVIVVFALGILRAAVNYQMRSTSIPQQPIVPEIVEPTIEEEMTSLTTDLDNFDASLDVIFQDIDTAIEQL